jgi:hypothetical protein
MVELWPRVLDRRPVRVHRRPVTARDGSGELEAVLDRPAHQRLERLGRRSGRLEEKRCRALERDDVIRRKHRACVVDRAGGVGELERAEAEQLDGAWAAVTADRPDALGEGMRLADVLGLRPFELADSARTIYHAGAVFASNYVVTLHRAASLLFETAGAPPEALEPLMRRTIENSFELTGPIARGDWSTVSAHRAAIQDSRPELDHLYETLAGATLALAT